ncbi:RidA family protein [Pontibacterium granulatum]|uniref:RidA family protein n=1 Tax=Pontibacterium granulatum TaxID=2036029 RepID=UPI00249ACA8A|nr:RidA family protein [Pontibacterium granulatum]MDI3323940.1 RidA family protein [Pontibacterium granulatum]
MVSSPYWRSVRRRTLNVDAAILGEVYNIKGQVQQIFEQAEASLATVDSDNSRILSVTIYLTDFANMEGLNEVWDAYFPEDCAPSRACVKAELANPGYLVEMAFTAAAGEKFL